MRNLHKVNEITAFFPCSCGGKYQCVNIDGMPAVLHTMPHCVAFEALEVTEFLEMQRKHRGIIVT